MNMEQAKKILLMKPCPMSKTQLCKEVNENTPFEADSVFLHTSGNTFVIDKIEGAKKHIRFIGGVKPYSKWTNASPIDIRSGGIGNPYYISVYGIGYRGEIDPNVSKELLKFAEVKWRHAVQRVAEDIDHQHVEISDDFLSLAGFVEWFKIYQNKAGTVPKDWELDKDLLGNGFSYSPESCCIIPGELNRILARLNSIYEYQYRAEHLAVYLDRQITLPIGSMTFEAIIRKVATQRLENVKRDLRNWEERFTHRLPDRVMNAIQSLQDRQLDPVMIESSAAELKEKFLNTDKKEVKYRLEFIEKFHGDTPVELHKETFRSLVWPQDSTYLTKGVTVQGPYFHIRLKPFAKKLRIDAADFNTFRSRALAVLMLRVKTFNGIEVLTEEELFERLRNYYGYDDESLQETFDAICEEHKQ